VWEISNGQERDLGCKNLASVARRERETVRHKD